MTLDGVTVVIQGRTDPECLKHYADRYGPSCIVSTWRDSPPDPLGMKMVLSDKPMDPGIQNCHFQFVSTLKGISEATTPYIIKVRGDEYFSNLEYVAEEMKKTHKILCLPIFFRAHRFFAFHPSDHMLAGSRDSLLTMFRAALKKMELGWDVPEQMLGAAYLEVVMNTQEIKKEHMQMHFDILDLEKVKDYRIVRNHLGWKFYNNFDPKVDGSPGITSMQEL